MIDFFEKLEQSLRFIPEHPIDYYLPSHIYFLSFFALLWGGFVVYNYCDLSFLWKRAEKVEAE